MKMIIMAPPDNEDNYIQPLFRHYASTSGATIVYIDKKDSTTAGEIVLSVPVYQKWNKRAWYAKQIQTIAGQSKAVVINFQPFVLPLSASQYCFVSKPNAKLCQQLPQQPEAFLVLPSLALQQWFVEKGIAVEKTIVSPAYERVKLLDYPQQATIKLSLSNGREYFLLEGATLSVPKLIEAIKAFSQFKKWQLSGLRLVIIGLDGTKHNNLTTKLEHYKYKDDVVITQVSDDICGAAFAYIYLAENTYSYANLLPFLQRGVPVITHAQAALAELDSAALFVDDANNLSLGSHMVTLYKDEKARKTLINAGKEFAAKAEKKFIDFLTYRHEIC